MDKFLIISRKLKYIGLLGLPMFFSNMAIWRFLWLFWLFAFVEIFHNFPVFVQSCKQVISIPYTILSRQFRLPNTDSYQSKISYSLPFSGEWTAVNGSSHKAMSHSWSILPQRYAYDFLILDKDGNSCKGDKTKLEDYYCYGKKVLAPADGIIIKVLDRYPDSKADGKGNAYCTAKDLRGNYILIKHSPNEYSLIAHLQPSSILVSAGQKVKRSEVMARCGNSGNTSEPHIHFQIQDSKSFFTSAGLPVSFKKIQIKNADNYNKFDPRPLKHPLPVAGSFVQYIHRGQSIANNERD